MNGPQAPSAVPSLLIGSRQSGIDRVWGTALAAVVVVIGAVVAGVTLLSVSVDSSAAFLVLAPAAPMMLVAVWIVVRAWRQIRAIATPIELHPAGLVLRAPQAVVHCPWEAVASIGFGRSGLTRTVVIRLHPQAGPDAPGMASTLTPRAWRTVRRHGLRYAAWLLDIDDAQFAAAVAELSGGRVHVAPRS